MKKVSWTISRQDALILVGGAILALTLRLSFFPVETIDYELFFGAWYEFIRTHEGLFALSQPFYDYTPVYLYLLTLASYLFARLPSIFAVKLILLPFDFICAALVYKVVQAKYPNGPAPVFAFLALLFTPTVILNTSYWGQVDILYTTCLVASLYFLIREHEISAILAFGLALATKLQALFFLPVLFILALLRRLEWKYFLLIPLVYLVTVIPAWLVGRPLDELLLIYYRQSETFHSLSMNAPNLYRWLPNDLYDIFYRAGLIWSVGAVFIFSMAVYRRRPQVSADLLVQLALISLLLMPYILPKMHDRYTFPADVFSIIYAFYFPGAFYIPLLVVGVSLLGYIPYLFRYELVPLEYVAFVPLITLTLLFYRLARSLQSSPS